MARFDPTRPDFSPYGFSCVRWTPTTMPRCDRHNEIELNLLEGGRLVYLMGGQKVTVPGGRLTVFWAGVPHQILEFECLTEYFVLTIPLAWFLQWRLPDHLTQPILHGRMIVEPDDGRLASDRARFEVWSEDVRIGSEERCHVSLLEIEARMRRLALTVAADSPRRSRRKSPAVLGQQHLSRAEEMARFIAQNYTQPLTAETISQHMGLHPNYAMALFQRAFGTTLIKYVTQHRLSHAQRLLLTTEDLILKIALSSGFGSLSRFNEAFRQAFGCTPREYRRLHQL
ncbi:MAG TPA: helix-turn-helix domain-containing protein [Thermoguttaceae bacterium]|nr:helix-turn-helix domain-containing protein [Thermoguttaceae bacterium]